MNKLLVKITFALVALVVVLFAGFGVLRNDVSSQKLTPVDNAELWQDVDESSLNSIFERQIVPMSYRTVRVNKTALIPLLTSAPPESQLKPWNSDSVISLPMPDGSFSRFRFVNSPIMEPGLAAQYPEITTYLGQGIDDPASTVRFDVTPKGFHAMILSENGSIFIDPFANGDTDNYISYFKRDFIKENRSFFCLVKDGPKSAADKKTKRETPKGPLDNLVNNGGTLRSYRLAVAATGEYTAFHGGTIGGALAAITTTFNRVNGIYERDLSIRMNLIVNNSLIIYTNAATDPYANDDTDLPANQANVDAVIGSANYDIGHLVGTGGGGVAQLNSPCASGVKAAGLTGSPAPVGDPFDVDYVAHEIGHQFGGRHTFNNNDTGSCGGNRSATAAVEPGSGATIQAYAGICGGQDIQRNSDDFFSIRSLEEMVAFSSGTTCDVETSPGNTAPVVTAAPACSIPRNTPFELTGSATDVNGDTLTYSWEEYDFGPASTGAEIPNTDAVGGAKPIFRAFKPSTTGTTRTFPSLPYILNNNNVPPSTFTGTNAVGTLCSFGACMTGELLPTISRTMQFQLVARDNRAGGGGVRSAQTAVTVDAASGPFNVTSQNAPVTYGGFSAQTVTWDVANTNVAPISCANVDITMSTNGGTTFTRVLATNTPNDGTELVTIPNVATTQGRIKIKCSTSCFFDISNANITTNVVVAASVSLGGRVVTAGGQGLSNAIVTVTNQSGVTRTVRTNTFGIYTVGDLVAGQTYVVSIVRKGFVFDQSTRIVTLNEDLADLTFIAAE